MEDLVKLMAGLIQRTIMGQESPWDATTAPTQGHTQDPTTDHMRGHTPDITIGRMPDLITDRITIDRTRGLMPGGIPHTHRSSSRGFRSILVFS
jgi:hypothetical protein